MTLDPHERQVLRDALLEFITNRVGDPSYTPKDIDHYIIRRYGTHTPAFKQAKKESVAARLAIASAMFEKTFDV